MKKILLLIPLMLMSRNMLLSQWYQQPFPTNESLWKVRFADSTTGWVLGNNFIYKTTDGGVSWYIPDSSSGSGGAMCVLDNGTVIHSDGGFIKKTTDGGYSWRVVHSDTNFYCNDITFVSHRTGYAVGGTVSQPFRGVIKKTESRGETWTTLTSNLGSDIVEGVSFVSESKGWIVMYNSEVYKTTNGGVDWFFQDSIWINYLPTRGIYFTTEDSGWVVGGIAGEMIIGRTTNGGQTWEKKRMQGSSLREVTFLNSKTGWFCGTSNSIPYIAKTTNGGESWLTQDFSPPTGIESISMINENLGWAVSINNSRNIYKTTNGGVTFVQENPPPQSPRKFELYQNYPNPFNPNTIIRYQLPEKGIVTLQVYDIFGRQIAVPVDRKEMEQGEHNMSFDGTRFPSGVYYYRLSLNDGEYSETRKLMLVK